ncbi:MAG: 2-hydroxyacyl-CoA dehydratase [Chloroflexi bacterium]|nr:2-hydroxyacyl-CoA dehydratase [Chloroflexota bacterium]
MSTVQTSIAPGLHTAFQQRHQYAREWKARTGGKVVGFFCTYVPEEIVYAAGMLPVRLFGAHQPQEVSERHIATMYCPYCRDVLAQGLLGRYDYLDGVVMANSCIHLRQAFESWRIHVPASFTYFLYMPCNVRQAAAVEVLTGELREFQSALESWGGRTISKTALKKAISVYDTNRRLLKQAYELRKADNPPIGGTEALDAVLAAQTMDKQEHSKLLSGALEGWKRSSTARKGARLMVVGSEDDDIGLVQLIESLGAVVVTDESCTGTRYFWNESEPDGDPLSAIARRYLKRPPCPSKDIDDEEPHQRLKFILDLAQQYRVKGVVILQQKFCHPHELDYPNLVKALQEKGLPAVHLEMDITIPYGQFRTRIEAFMEMLE